MLIRLDKMARDKYFYGIIFLQSCPATSMIFFKRLKHKMAEKIYPGEWRKCQKWRRKKFLDKRRRIDF